MAKPPRHIPRDTSRRRMSVYIAVAAFFAVDILLIVLALGSTQVGAESEAPQAIPTFDAVASTSAPTVTPSSTPVAEAILPLPPTRLLGAVDEKTAWRAVTGDCPATPASPELTTDGGATWKKTDATGPAKVTALQRLLVTSESVVEMVVLAKSDCAPQLVKTFVGGDTFKAYPDELDGAWFVDPADRATIHSPSGSAMAPCDAVVSLAVINDKAAAALCADGRLFATEDAAVTWSSPASIPGAVALTATDTGYLAAAVGRAECAGVQLLTLTPTLEATEFGCYKTDAQPASLAGNVAVSTAADTLWLWAVGAFVRSADGGANWQ